MKIRSKKTGEIREVREILIDGMFNVSSLAELEEWEDYEEPKEYCWFIDDAGDVSIDKVLCSKINMRKSIGNYFETKEEAEQAVEKLKAWKRLKEAGFMFTFTPAVGSLDISPDKFQIDISAEMPEKYFCNDSIIKDIDLLFGGEECEN